MIKNEVYNHGKLVRTIYITDKPQNAFYRKGKALRALDPCFIDEFSKYMTSEEAQIHAEKWDKR